MSEQRIRANPVDPHSLSADDVHIWTAALDQPEDRIASLWQSLSGDEKARAARFHFAVDRSRFIVARGFLRAVLGGYLGIAPNQLEFAYGERGKPVLSGAAGMCGLHFNLAHSNDLALCAVAYGREVGVDLERVRTVTDLDGLAQAVFSPREVASLQSLPEPQREEAFFNCWTRKEAYLKAVGDGLWAPLSGFDVSLAPGEPARMLSIGGHARAASDWTLLHLAPAPEYVGALALRGFLRRPVFRYWAPASKTY